MPNIVKIEKRENNTATVTFDDGSTYNGEWSGETMNGMGVYNFSNGNIYKGNFVNGKMEGKGTLTFPDGKIYQGEFANGKPHGLVISILPNGEKYEGDFVNGKPHGLGILSDSSGTYAGDFVDGKMHGLGTLTFPDGEIYKGEFVNGKPHGLVISILPSDEKDEKYEGYFANGKPHGLGTLTDSSGTYKGDFVDGKRHGRGTFTFPNLAKYEGDFADGQMHGRGTFTFRNRSIYKGDFVDGKRHGRGTFTFRSGVSVSGVFEKDTFIPDARKAVKPDHKIIKIEIRKGYVPDTTPAIANSYGINEDQIKIVNEETPIPSIEECVCERKDGLRSQVLVAINEHGGVNGNFGNQDFIIGKLTELSAAIKAYNESKTDKKKVKRVKLNLSTCHGDACITTSLLEIIKTFTDAGIEVRTSAIKGGSKSSSIIGNGKNYAADGNETVIVERLFTPSKPEAEKFASEKMEKYQAVEIIEMPNSIFCASGEKHYKDLAALLQDNYDKPSAAVKATDSENANATKPPSPIL